MLKRPFDFLFSLLSLLVLMPVVLGSWLFSAIDTSSNGLFLQERIGQFGKPFLIYKLRTMHPTTNKISKIGAFLRRYKLDELPQLLNVLQGTMSVVGPRPDIKGYYDILKGEEQLILQLKPGLTSVAAIKYANEEELLQCQSNPLKYNNTIIFPDKVQLNLNYYYNHTFWGDINIIWKTILVVLI